MWQELEIPVKFRQYAAGNCGLYSLANLFDDADFVAKLVPQVGQNTFELNSFLREKRQDVYLTTDYLIPLGFGRITDHTCFSPEDGWTYEGGCMANIFIVATGKYLHALAVLMLATSEREVFVIDSLRPNVIQTTLPEFFERYHVQGLLNFRLDNGPSEDGAAACWHADFFTHILPEHENVIA
jgi:hypothetical protein